MILVDTSVNNLMCFFSRWDVYFICYYCTDHQQGLHSYQNQHFQDPAIMSSVRYATPSLSESGFLSTPGRENFSPRLPYGPPPGLSLLPSQQAQSLVSSMNANNRPQLHMQQRSGGHWIENGEMAPMMNEAHGESFIFTPWGRVPGQSTEQCLPSTKIVSWIRQSKVSGPESLLPSHYPPCTYPIMLSPSARSGACLR